MMKKLTLAAMALTAMTGLYSCLGNGSEQHGTTVYPRGNKGLVEMFADQTADTFVVVSCDSWVAKVNATENGATWFSITPEKQDIPDSYMGTQVVNVMAKPNTSGFSRVGTVTLTTSYENQQLALPVYQYGWLNITTPQPTYTSEKLAEAKAVFANSLMATTTQAPMVFTVHASATLKSDVSWLTVPAEKQTLMPGTHTVILTLEPNTGKEDRVGHVSLTSYGITNEVTYTQKGVK